MRLSTAVAGLAAYALSFGAAQAAVTVYDEGVHGDGGDTSLTATDLGTVADGDGLIVRGTVGGDDPFDYFTFTLLSAADIVLSGLTLTGTNASSGFPVTGLSNSTAVSFASNGIGLPTLIASLPAGRYTVRPAEFSDDVSTYELAIGTVPVPAAALLFAPAVLGAGALRRRKR